MAKTLLQIGQEVARRVRTPSPVPTAIVGIESAETLYQAILDAADFMTDAHDWSILHEEGTITTVASQESYTPASDYHHLVPDTSWDTTNDRYMRGSTSPARWQWLKQSSVTVGQLRKDFRFKATEGQGSDGEILIFPTPTAVESLLYEYVSENWAADSGGTPKNTMDADTDTPRIPDRPLSLLATAFLMESEGLVFVNRRNDAENHLAQAIANDAPTPTVSANRDVVLRRGLWNSRAWWPCNTPDGGFG